jgi:CDP-paratose 2-epimerase
MKMLLTGAAGFVGSRIARYMKSAKENLDLWAIDNLSRPGSEGNLNDLTGFGCRFIRADIRCASDLEAIPAMDWIIDCAANPSVLAGISHSTRQLVEHNLCGTVNLLEKCRQDNSGLCLISTSRVYSAQKVSELPLKKTGSRFSYAGDVLSPVGISEKGVTEQFPTSAPISLYGATKLSSEILALEYASAFGFPIRIARCGVIAGAGQFGRADQGVFSYWVHSYRAKRSLSFIGYGGLGLQVRDCLHPDDLARLLLRQIEAKGDSIGSAVCNVSGGLSNSMSLSELTDWCEGKFGKHRIGADPRTRPFDVPWLILDCSQAQEQWNWKPEISINSILEEIAEHAQGNPQWLDICG